MNELAYSQITYRNGHYLDEMRLQDPTQLVINDLKELGLTERESEVYISLSRKKIMKAGDLSRELRLHKAQTYHILRSLQEKGLTSSSIEVPTRFTAVPLDKVLNVLIKARIEDAKHLEYSRAEVLSRWRSIGSDISVLPLERFQILSDRNKIYARILDMIEEADNEVAIIASCQGAIQYYEAEVRDAILQKAKRNRTIKFRLLLSIEDEALATAKDQLEKVTQGLGNVDVHFIQVATEFFPRFVLKDSEALVFVTPRNVSLRANKEESALWTNSSSVTNILRIFYERFWKEAIDSECPSQSVVGLVRCAPL